MNVFRMDTDTGLIIGIRKEDTYTQCIVQYPDAQGDMKGPIIVVHYNPPPIRTQETRMPLLIYKPLQYRF